MSEKIVLVDGNSILNRAFYGIPDLTNSKGLHTNGVFGFLNILFKILEEEKPQYLTIAFDVKHPTFRHERYAAYKGTRKPMPEELREQLPLIKEVLAAMEVATIEKAGYEADDILGTLAVSSAKEGLLVSLISGDRDLLQLASEQIKIRIPRTKQGRTEVEDYHAREVVEKYGITPSQIIDLKGLMGDASDNIPGVPGIGEKTAVKILTAFESVENAYSHIEEVMPNRARESLRENYDLALLSKELATIKLDCELPYDREQARIRNIYNEKAFRLMKELEFKSLLAKFNLDVGHDAKLEAAFRIVEDKKSAARIGEEIRRLSAEEGFVLGIKLFPGKGGAQPASGDGQYSLFDAKEAGEEPREGLLGISLAYGKRACFLKGNALPSGKEEKEAFAALLKKLPALSVIDLKPQLPLLGMEEAENITDLCIGAYLLNPLKDDYHYDDLARDYLAVNLPSYGEMFGKKSLEEASAEENFYLYCCYEAYAALEAYEPIREALMQNGMEDLFYQVEMPLVYTLYHMERRGIKVNKEALFEYGASLAARILELEQSIYKLAEEEFNINSPKQLGAILFEKLKLPNGKKTKTGYSTSADVLEKLESEHPIIGDILEYRQLAKLKSTYADGLAVCIEEDGRIHGTLNQTITATGRLSSTEPNLQNIPIRMELGRKIRKVFIPEEGYVFLDADYSQIELRILAHMSGDERLIAAYREAQDIHRITASEVFHTPLDQVSGAQRSNAKAVNFGIVYGISSFGLGQGLNITRKEAESYIHNYFETYPRVKEFLDELVASGKKHGYADSLFGRRRPIPELSSGNFMQRSFGERIAMNSPIQGTAADIMKIAMNRVEQRLKREGLHSRLILQIHDELLVETKREEISRVKEILEQEMFHAAQLRVPLEVEVSQGDNWYESK